MNSNALIVGLLILVVLGAGGWYLFGRSASQEQPANGTSEVFVAEGNIVRNNPGLEPDTWYLVYEEQGSPALTAKLDLSETPYSSLTQGDRVRVEGTVRNSTVVVHSITKMGNEAGLPILLYYYNPARDQGAGGAQCSRAGLVPVQRVIPATDTPLEDSVQLLLRGELSEEDRAQGITTEFPLAGFVLENASISNATATLSFRDPQSKTSGGACRTGILWFQIEATAKQFPSVENVRFLPEELFQP